jgi:hypothetical protein
MKGTRDGVKVNNEGENPFKGCECADENIGIIDKATFGKLARTGRAAQ